jgi:hypothetical protein
VIEYSNSKILAYFTPQVFTKKIKKYLFIIKFNALLEKSRIDVLNVNNLSFVKYANIQGAALRSVLKAEPKVLAMKREEILLRSATWLDGKAGENVIEKLIVEIYSHSKGKGCLSLYINLLTYLTNLVFSFHLKQPNYFFMIYIIVSVAIVICI